MKRSSPRGKESFNVPLIAAATVLIIFRSSSTPDGAVGCCIIAATSGASSGSRVGYLSKTDIVGMVFAIGIESSEIKNSNLGVLVLVSPLSPFLLYS